MIRILIVDDQSMIRVGIRAILSSQDDMTVVGEAENGRLGVDKYRSLRPDVVLMDVRMPVMDGLAAARAMLGPERVEGHLARVLMLTTFDLDDYIYAALRAGASGFLLKDTRPEDLVAAIRVVARGEALLAPTITRRLLDRFASELPGGRTPPRLDVLSDREVEVLTLVARALSNDEIAERLTLSRATVKTHLSAILTKLGLRDRVQAVVLAYESGLVRPGGDGDPAGTAGRR